MNASPTRTSRRLPMGLRSASLPALLLSACVGLPAVTTGVTRRADVLLAFGEPVLALDHDRVLVHVWLPSSRFLVVPQRGMYRAEAGILRRWDVALPTPSMQAPQRPSPYGYVVHEFDAHGVLLRRLP